MSGQTWAKYSLVIQKASVQLLPFDKKIDTNYTNAHASSTNFTKVRYTVIDK